MKTIAIDVDGVIADNMTQWLNLYNQEYNDVLNENDIQGWNIHMYVREECGTKIYRYLHESNFIHSMNMYPGTYNALYRLSGLYNVVIVTAQTGSARIEWIRRHLPFIRDAVIAKDKTIVTTDIIVDDAVHNLEKHPASFKILWTRPWNIHDTRFLRVQSWKELINLLWIMETREH